MTVMSIFLVLSLLVLFIRFRQSKNKGKPLVQVVVLGDIGHSPRMQYHALSLAETGRVCVELIGFRGATPLQAICSNRFISLRFLRETFIPPSWRIPFLVYAAIKIVYESLQLFMLLVTSRCRAEVILVQTPPAIPSLFVCGVVSCVSGSKLIVDFHNITYMHLESKVKNCLIIGAVRFYEKWMSGWFSDSGFAVTKSMKLFLETNFGLNSLNTLYDRPGPQFKGRTSAEAKQDLESRLLSLGVIKKKLSSYDFIIASSTSWTRDEDFSLVLRALPKYSKKSLNKRTLLFITGKGEMQNRFVSDFSLLNLSNIDLVTAWLPAADYPLLLGSANVGISVHTSTSGLDLPMKAVDMLGCELPVIALKFPSLVEMLGEGEGGITFTTSDELADALILLLESEELRDKFSKYGKRFRTSSDWKTEWLRTAWPVFDRYLSKTTTGIEN
jgi:beta-1,4-mannosyltransferase